MSKEDKFKNDLNSICERMDCLSEMLRGSNNSYESLQSINMLSNEIEMLRDLKDELQGYNDTLEKEIERMQGDRIFTLSELASFDGSSGKPAYVAIDGIVYDASKVSSWGGGTHFGLVAGQDLSKELDACHAKDIVNKLTKIGVLKV